MKSHREVEGDSNVVKAPSDCSMAAGLEGVGPERGHLGEAERRRDGGEEEWEPNQQHS